MGGSGSRSITYRESYPTTRGEQSRPDLALQKEGSGSETPGDMKNMVGGRKTAGRWILQSVNIVIIYSFL
ncbi:hypothetical protein TNCT_374071 [Trichonephila clavata]|uniref:Uncharacterized protein n=1 Tax=Trichonephila clavata TaxID=2740835 RepID=A0A8X6KIQ6_TRICU|nr:hypothetical protein TNCT_374071 [Trichonephila clavata]